MRKREISPITGVLFSYVGTDEQFNTFLRAMLRDYLTDGKTPSEKSFDIAEHRGSYLPESVVVLCADKSQKERAK